MTKEIEERVMVVMQEIMNRAASEKRALDRLVDRLKEIDQKRAVIASRLADNPTLKDDQGTQQQVETLRSQLETISAMVRKPTQEEALWN